MKLQSRHTVFLAIPFDAATTPMYRRTLRRLKKRFGKRFNFVFGNNNVIPPSPQIIRIQHFKAQNDDLLKQFHANILAADIVIADLTHNNPNVHVELGIAITLNKNILRLTSRNIVEVGSDVKGYDVDFYRDEADLRARIGNYLKQFLEIKDTPLNKTAGALYSRKLWSGKEFKHSQQERQLLPIHQIGFMRDGAIRLKFRFQSVENPTVWFGIYFRYGGENPWLSPGYLIYVRKTGALELAELPSVTIIRKIKYPQFELKTDHLFEVAFSGNKLNAIIDGAQKMVKADELLIQSPGKVSIGNVDSVVKVSRVEIVSRDTINTLGSSARSQ